VRSRQEGEGTVTTAVGFAVVSCCVRGLGDDGDRFPRRQGEDLRASAVVVGQYRVCACRTNPARAGR
jgi:hypothetical protein